MMQPTFFAPSPAAISSSSPVSASAGVALSALLDERLLRAGRPTARSRRARRTSRRRRSSIIYLFMAGAPTQLDLFDNKPALQEYDGQEIPAEFVPKGERFAFIKGTPRLLGSPFTFKRYGQSGAELSELLPHLATIADDIAIVRSMHTTQFNHAPGQIFMNTGSQVFGRPSMGSWLTYGLGSESRDLPGFVVLLSGENAPDGGKSCWGSGFLPTVYQGVEFRSKGDPVLFVSNPDGVDDGARRESLDLVTGPEPARSERRRAIRRSIRASRRTRWRTGCRAACPSSRTSPSEPAAVHAMYGTQPGKVSFANNCLLARRLVERGVRFVQLYHRGWDTHGASVGDRHRQSRARAVPRDRSRRDRARAAISSSAVCSTRRSSSGAASSAGRR